MSEDGKHHFLHITEYNSKGFNFLVKKENEEWVNSIIHDFIYNYLANNITQESKNFILLLDKPSYIVGTREISNHILVFIQLAK